MISSIFSKLTSGLPRAMMRAPLAKTSTVDVGKIIRSNEINAVKPIAIQDDDIYAPTDLGNDELRSASTALSLQQLEFLVTIDGQATVRELAQSTPALALDDVRSMLRNLLDAKLIRLVHTMPSDSLDFTGFLTLTPAPSPSPGALQAASNEASAGTVALQQKGYYVSIARAAATPRSFNPNERLSAVVIEDEPHLGKLLRTYFGLENIDATLATNRNEIVTAFEQTKIPDFILLDVMLPDTDGFDVLANIRRHPALNKVPVVMLTAKATRESVLRGLAGGADGYITKPFEVENLLKAVRSVLGIRQSTDNKSSAPFSY